jgi:hypothetical protein
VSACDYCQDNPTAGPRGERCPICGALFGDAPPAPVETYRDDPAAGRSGGCYLPAKGAAVPCWHVYAGAVWYELFDFGPPRAVVAVPYGPTANREALGRKCEPWELPARIAARIAELPEGAP